MITTKIVREAPLQPEMEPGVGVVYLVVLEDQELPWMCCFRCPCGCDRVVSLPFVTQSNGRVPSNLPLWDFKSYSPLHIEPSINMLGGCKAHFFIRNGQFQHC